MKQAKEKRTPELREFMKQLRSLADAAERVPNKTGLLALNPRVFYEKRPAGMVSIGQVGGLELFVLIHAPEPEPKGQPKGRKNATTRKTR